MYELELYTHPLCSDCKDSKAYLNEQNVAYTEYDVSKAPEKEDGLKKQTGSRVVPGFVFTQTSLLGKMKKPLVFTGFERNASEIKLLVQKM
ncbi:glutaredoxin family protein [Salicibibacter halophilus]|uniref:Glutaredoxin family protein n=1 Tax=Salicibibacter halophilus TaxID=2502791 RepID=A0A514LDY5_9BACI|nr:glutaredoxin family protein [Salicibibacter halophilus]QDI90060.1 glutaredoxin family protein [Salicibibacter halophilus]